MQPPDVGFEYAYRVDHDYHISYMPETRNSNVMKTVFWCAYLIGDQVSIK